MFSHSYTKLDKQSRSSGILDGVYKGYIYTDNIPGIFLVLPLPLQGVQMMPSCFWKMQQGYEDLLTK